MSLCSLCPRIISGRGRVARGFFAGLALFIALSLSVTAIAADGSMVRAVKLMNKGNWEEARRLVSASGDPAGAALYNWMFFREESASGNFDALARFLRTRKAWPKMDALYEKAEKAMPAGMSNAAILAWFTDHPPLSAYGLDRYAEALLLSGRKAEAQKIVREWWVEELATRDEQRMIYQKYGTLIDRNAHRRRLDRLLFSDQFTNARAIAAVIGPGFPALVEARIALSEEKGNANALVAKIPRALQDDPGLMYERLRWRRMHDMNAEAVDLFLAHPSPAHIQNPEGWWKEQHILIRRLLERGKYKGAHTLAAKHFQTEGESFAEAEWLAGWLALRYMNQPAEALRRFENLDARVKTPISKARAAYWAGRASKALHNDAKARDWYQKAAKFQTTYYGQLAGAALGIAQSLPHAAPPVLESGDKSKFSSNEMIRAAQILRAAGMQDEAGWFLKAFVESEQSPKAYRFAAELAAREGAPFLAVKIAKEATNKGLFLTTQSYPVIADRLKNVPQEWALVHAVIRQESMFDSGALSPAGARGLMQLMPATARQVAKRHGISISESTLTANPQVNVRLGSAYMQEMLDRYDQSYPLAIAAYNAGPGRVDGWIRTFGDPRNPRMNLIDWIEMIPIAETRNYVQRVLEGTYVYRLRLKNIQKSPRHALHVAQADKRDSPG